MRAHWRLAIRQCTAHDLTQPLSSSRECVFYFFILCSRRSLHLPLRFVKNVDACLMSSSEFYGNLNLFSIKFRSRFYLIVASQPPPPHTNYFGQLFEVFFSSLWSISNALFYRANNFHRNKLFPILSPFATVSEQTRWVGNFPLIKRVWLASQRQWVADIWECANDVQVSFRFTCSIVSRNEDFVHICK